MTEEEKEAIEWLKNKPQECTSLINSCSYIGNKKAYAKDRTMFKVILNLIQKQQKEMQKKDKQIDLMADELTCEEFELCCSECTHECEKDYDQLSTCIKQYFEKQAEEV